MSSDPKTGLMTGTFYATNLLDHLDRIRSTGYEFLEIWCYEPHFLYQDDNFIKLAQRRLANGNFQVRSLHATFHGILDLSGPDDCDRVHALETVKKQAILTSQLGGEIIVVHPGQNNVPENGRVKSLGYFMRALDVLVPFCNGLGIQIAVENMPPDYLGDNIKEMAVVLNNYDYDVGLCLDTSHAHLTGELSSYLNRFGNRILGFHVSDAIDADREHLPPGEGNIDWSNFANAVKGIGFRSPLMLEVLGRNSEDLYEAIGKSRENLDRLLAYQ